MKRCIRQGISEGRRVELSVSSLNAAALGFDAGCIMQEYQVISGRFQPGTNG